MEYLQLIFKTIFIIFSIKLILHIFKIKYSNEKLLALLIILISNNYLALELTLKDYVIIVISLSIIYRVFLVDKHIIINNGIINFNNLINNNYKIKDLINDLNSHGIRRLSDVKAAIIENNNLSIYKKIMRK